MFFALQLVRVYLCLSTCLCLSLDPIIVNRAASLLFRCLCVTFVIFFTYFLYVLYGFCETQREGEVSVDDGLTPLPDTNPIVQRLTPLITEYFVPLLCCDCAGLVVEVRLSSTTLSLRNYFSQFFLCLLLNI